MEKDKAVALAGIGIGGGVALYYLWKSREGNGIEPTPPTPTADPKNVLIISVAHEIY